MSGKLLDQNYRTKPKHWFPQLLDFPPLYTKKGAKWDSENGEDFINVGYAETISAWQEQIYSELLRSLLGFVINSYKQFDKVIKIDYNFNSNYIKFAIYILAEKYDVKLMDSLIDIECKVLSEYNQFSMGFSYPFVDRIEKLNFDNKICIYRKNV